VLEAVQIGERPNPYESERIASERSLLALDWLNFFKADAQTTVGPFLAIFLLAVRHWDLARIGMMMAVPGVATTIAQAPAGALVDAITWKRTLVALSALGLGAGCLLLVTTASLTAIALGQGIIAIVTVVMPPAIAAITVGLVGHRAFARRMGRNEAYSHAGAVAGAIVVGALGYWVARAGIFYFAALMSLALAVAAMAVRREEIDPALARQADVDTLGTIGIVSLPELLHNSRIMLFAGAVVLFHLANAAMLPLVGEMLSDGHPTLAVPYMSACIVISQHNHDPDGAGGWQAGRFVGSQARLPDRLGRATDTGRAVRT
jgi:MFS family permease